MEEPLEIRLASGPADDRVERSVAVTMRTPGDDVALALGFLHGEGVVTHGGRWHVGRRNDENVVTVELAPTVQLRRGTAQAERLHHLELRRLRQGLHRRGARAGPRPCRPRLVQGRPRDPGGAARAAAGASRRPSRGPAGSTPRPRSTRTDASSAVAEDVGRHNALDKLVGGYLSDGRLPMTELGLIFSGRASFELMQKAAMAGCPFVAAIGPPSSLAIDLAAEQRMTLVGFLRQERFNVYTLPHRVLIGA